MRVWNHPNEQQEQNENRERGVGQRTEIVT